RRKALRLDQSLATAFGAAEEIRALCRVLVVLRRDALADVAQHVHGALGMVAHLFRLADCPAPVDRACGVTVVGRCSGVAALDHLSEQLMKDHARESAVADLHVAAGPVLLWQPDFETDARLRRWRRMANDAAERRQILEHGAE